MYLATELMEEIADDTELIEAYKPHWRFIKTHYEQRNSKKIQQKRLYVIRATDPSGKYLASILKLIHKEQQVAYRYNLQFSYILKNVETMETRLYYRGNNSRYHDTPPLIENDKDLDKELINY